MDRQQTQNYDNNYPTCARSLEQHADKLEDGYMSKETHRNLLDPRMTKAKKAMAQGPTGYLVSSFYSVRQPLQMLTLVLVTAPSLACFSYFLDLRAMFLSP